MSITGSLFEGFGSMYATIAKANHEIKWWAVIMAGLIIRQSMISIASPRIQELTAPMQRAVSYMLNFAIVFCVMLIVIQFEPIWMPIAEWIVDQAAELIDYIGDLS